MINQVRKRLSFLSFASVHSAFFLLRLKTEAAGLGSIALALISKPRAKSTSFQIPWGELNSGRGGPDAHENFS